MEDDPFSSASHALDLILRLSRLDRLPLHVARRVEPATGQRLDVIDHVAGATIRKASLPREGVLGCCAALNAAARVASPRCSWTVLSRCGPWPWRRRVSSMPCALRRS